MTERQRLILEVFRRLANGLRTVITFRDSDGLIQSGTYRVGPIGLSRWVDGAWIGPVALPEHIIGWDKP